MVFDIENQNAPHLFARHPNVLVCFDQRCLCSGCNCWRWYRAGIMGREQVRRLPVVENGKLCGMVSLGDIAVREDTVYDAGDALMEISSGISSLD